MILPLACFAGAFQVAAFNKSPFFIGEPFKSPSTLLINPQQEVPSHNLMNLLPTSYAPEAADDVFVKSYDISTGLVTLDRYLSYYHFGAAESTASKYSGVDIRGEVLLLTRNVLIEGYDEEGWGC